MKLSNLKPGSEVQVYCFGELVKAKVIKRYGNGWITEHKPIRWGNDDHTQTFLNPSSWLQSTYNGSQTTPKAFYKGKEITI